MTGWWATAARALALVLALVVAMPAAGLAEDFSYHRGHQGHDRTERALASDATPGFANAADPGLSCHIHCGCHVAVDLHEAAVSRPVLASRPSYARVTEIVASVFPDRLPRPPRA